METHNKGTQAKSANPVMAAPSSGEAANPHLVTVGEGLDYS